MVTLLVAAFTEGGLGLGAMLLGGLAFVATSVLGKDENGILSGLFKKDTTTPPAGDSPAPDVTAPAPALDKLLEQTPSTDTDVNKKLPKQPPASGVQITP